VRTFVLTLHDLVGSSSRILTALLRDQQQVVDLAKARLEQDEVIDAIVVAEYGDDLMTLHRSTTKDRVEIDFAPSRPLRSN